MITSITTASTITIRLNDVERSVVAGTSLATLLEQESLSRPYMAASINQTIVPRSQHATYELRANDQIIVVHAVGGG